MKEQAKRFWNNRKLFLILLAIFIGVGSWFGWQIWRSYNVLTTQKDSVITPMIQTPVRIVFLSDLHENTFGENNEKLIKEITLLDPDLICLGGDLINEDTADFESLLSLAKRLKNVAPVYCTPGNKELENDKWEILEKSIEEVGVPVLDGAYQCIEVNGNFIALGGLYDNTFALNGEDSVVLEQMNPNTVSFLEEYSALDMYKVLLCHRPDSVYFNTTPEKWNLNLVLSGHTHGGQVVLGNGQGLWAPDQGFFPAYTHGKTRVGDIDLITTSGLGSGNEKLPRFNNPAEILVVDLLPSE